MNEVHDPGFHYWIWVVDGGDHPPLVVIVGTPAGVPELRAAADDVLGTLVIGGSQPHPVDPADWGIIP